jgi:predicted nucleotidyltransferase
MPERLLNRNPAARRALGLLSTVAGAELHTREIARRTRVDPHSVQLALTQLLNAGLVRSRRLGNLRLWTIAPGSRELHELARTLRSEAGAVEQLRAGLRVMQVPVAFIFGSFASVSDQPDSDIDLFIAGSVNWNQVAELTQTVERDVGRPLNLVVWSQRELEHPSPRQRSFLVDVLLRPRIFVIGSEADLEPARDAVARAMGRGRGADRPGPNEGR